MLKKKGLLEKHPSTEVESFIMTLFDLIKIGKVLFTKKKS